MKNLIRVLLLVSLVLSISACVAMPRGKHQVDVILKDSSTNELRYVAIHKNRTRAIDKFESEEIKIYYAEDSCFSTYTKDNEIYSKLVRIVLQDKDGNPIESNKTIENIFKAADGYPSNIWRFQVIQVGEEYFALIKINTNWVSPCDFVRYDEETQELELLKTFEDVDVVGIRLVDENKE